MSSNSLVFHTSGVFYQALPLSYFYFFSTESSFSCVNCPSLMSSWLLKFFVIGSSVSFGGFPSKFSRCCFHICIRSYWLVAFSLAFTVLLLLLTSFMVCHTILDCLSSAEFLILLIWFCMYSVCSFWHMLVNSFCAFLSFWVLILVGFLLLCREAISTSACFFFLTTNVSHGTLGLALCLVGNNSSFGVGVSDIS